MSVQLQDYLQLQTGVTFKKLYQQPATVLAVLRRMLPHLAKNIVMAILFMHEPFSEKDLMTWFRDEASGSVDATTPSAYTNAAADSEMKPCPSSNDYTYLSSRWKRPLQKGGRISYTAPLQKR
jgi:hypothetical protein